MGDSVDAKAVQRHVERMRVLYEASQLFAEQVTDPAGLLTTIARTCSELVGDFSSVILVRDGGEWLDVVAVHHPDAAIEREFRAFALSTPARVGEGVMGGVVRDKKALLLAEVDPEAIVARAPAAYQAVARRLNVCSFVGVPMQTRGRVIGGISMARSRPGVSYAPEDVACLQDLADRAALAFENARLLAATRLKSAFLANMSHELRTPLSAIIGFGDLLNDGMGGPLTEMQKEFTGHIVTSSRHLLGLINDILDLSKVEAGKLEFWPVPVDPAAILAEVASMLRPTASSRHIDLRTGSEALTAIVIDPVRLRQVLYNYLSNALKFTPEGGTVEVRIVAAGDDAFRIEVEDSGVGIAEDELPLLFAEFQQLPAGAATTHAGTGLGLALTRRLVEAQGGTVGVRSTVGKGSVFHAVLPRRPRARADSRTQG